MQPTPLNQAVAQALLGSLLFSAIFPAAATTPLADRPPLVGGDVPGNLALTVSVEFPTAISVAHPNRNYSATTRYIGYFDPEKCYSYNSTDGYFQPEGPTASKTSFTCSGQWSGNYMNWATMQTIDPFRWALTGGYRAIDTPTLTVLEKAIGTNQGGNSNFPDSAISGSTTVSGATPFNKSDFRTSIRTRGNRMRFIVSNTGSFNNNVAAAFTSVGATIDGTQYEVIARVRVCDASKGLEPNCVQYPNGGYKPEGLMQKYADRIRYSVFGYLNDGNLQRDGAVLRAKKKFIGLTEPVSGGLPKATSNPEWDATTGVMLINPNATEATAASSDFGVSITNSGVMNYVNKFGTVVPGTYKTFDPVGELYYAAHRYFRNVGNVPAWIDMGAASTATKTTWLDGFPVIKTWDDPVLYSCQRNFILGIGDVNTHADRNLPGGTGSSEPAKPTAVSNDELAANNNMGVSINSTAWTNKIGSLMGIGTIGNAPYGFCCNNNGPLMAGLAFQANVMDIRKDMPGKQTIQTYWVDVLENGYRKDNQFYLATKYGGFDAGNYNPSSLDAITSEIPKSLWATTTDTAPNGDPRPDAYFTAARADQMAVGLTKIFADIASKLQAYTTSFSSALPQVVLEGEASYATRYEAKTWTGDVQASKLTFSNESEIVDSNESWKFSEKLGTAAAGTGWNTNRRMVTFNPESKAAVPFRLASLSSAQRANLDTNYVAGDDSQEFLNFLRGDKSNEKSVGGKGYRDRVSLVGDIVNSKIRVVGRPASPFSDSVNPGYSAFRTTHVNRPNMLVVGTNQGVLHVINGSLTGTAAGTEIFSYVPSFLFNGPSATPNINGLASLGKTEFKHHNFVDATPIIANIDFGKVKSNQGAPDWRTIAVGGLGKGGKGLYAIDLTTAHTVTTEAQAATRILWEFTDPDLGFQYSEPSIVKTAQHGWVVVVGSGYNNTDGKGYFFLIDPRNGSLIQKISTGVGTTMNQAGLSAVNPFVLDATNGIADTVYAGDLLGNLWRLDLTKTSGGYDAPLLLAQLTDADNVALPVTARPLVVIQPSTKRRWVTVGTGRLLDSSDLGSSQSQRFYAIMDGSNAKPNATADLPAAVGGFPISNADLRKLTDTSQKITLDTNKEIGWYLELGNSWRVLSDSTAFFGTVAFPAMAPTTADACNPGGTNRIYVLNLGDGTSFLQGKAAYNSSLPGVITDLKFYSVDGDPRLYAGSDVPKNSSSDKNPPIEIGTEKFKKDGSTRLNWRELPLSN